MRFWATFWDIACRMPVLVHRGDSSILTTRVHFPSGSSPHLWTVRKGQALKPLELLSYFLDVSSWDLVPVEGVHSSQSYFFEQIQTKRKSNWTKYCPVVLPVCGIGRGYTGKFRLSEIFCPALKSCVITLTTTYQKTKRVKGFADRFKLAS